MNEKPVVDHIVMHVATVRISGDRNLYLYTFGPVSEEDAKKRPPEAEADGQVLG